MKPAIRRRPSRVRLDLESLEARALLAGAGAVVASFGDQGTSVVPFSAASPFQTGATIISPLSAIQSDGKILLGASFLADAGSSEPAGSTMPDFAIERLNANGTPDTSFGTNGLATFAVGIPSDEHDELAGLIVEPDGMILASGYVYDNRTAAAADNYSVVIEVTSSGTLDTSFGTDGMATLSTSSGGLTIAGFSAIALTPGGNIVVTGAAYNSMDVAGTEDIPESEFFAAELNADGTLDTSFGTSGIATVPVTVNGELSDAPRHIAVQSSGRIIIEGQVVRGVTVIDGGSDYLEYDTAFVGLTASGAVDTTFGTNGETILAPDPGDPTSTVDMDIEGLALESNGSIVGGAYDISGIATTDPQGYLAFRLTPNGTLDPTFGTNGMAFTNPELTANGVAVEPNGDVLVLGTIGGSNSPMSAAGVSTIFAVERFNANGTPDTSFGQADSPGVASYPTTVSTPSTDIEFNYTPPEYASGELTGAVVNSSGQIILTGYVAGDPYSGDLVSFAAVEVSPTPTITLAVAQPPADLANTGTTDFSVYLTSAGAFAYLPTTNPALGQVVPFGIAGAGQTIPAIADYDGLGYDQIAAYLPTSGVYAILPTDGKPGLFEPFGVPGAGQTIPVPADYYGTGQADVAVYIPAQGIFAIQATATQPGRIIPFGIAGAGRSIPAPADYYNTGQDDIAVYLAQAGEFAILAPGGQAGEIIPFGPAGLGRSIPVPGDYDDSGKTELAVYVPSLGAFFYRPADGAPDVEVPFGIPNSGEIPVPGDYDGSGHTEFAVYDPARGFLAYRPADGAPDVIEYFGGANVGAIPVAANPATLPEFTGESPGSSTNAIRAASVPAGSTASASTNAVSLSRSTALPSGPTLASARVALSLVNQAESNPLKFPS